MARLEVFLEMHFSVGQRRARPTEWDAEDEPDTKRARLDESVSAMEDMMNMTLQNTAEPMDTSE